MSRIRDQDIRRRIHSQVLDEFRHDPETRVIDELGLCQGEAIVDVAVINGQIHGFEIKSQSDDIRRLPHQVAIYGRVLDRATLVTAEQHAEATYAFLPPWWQVLIVRGNRDRFELVQVREGAANLQVDPRAVVELLWRDEALALLAAQGADRGLKSKPKRAVWDALVERLDRRDLLLEVREAVKRRTGWRPGD